MSKSFSTAVANAKLDPILFDIDGDEFAFDPPKTAVLMMALVDSDEDGNIGRLAAMLDWLRAGLPEEQMAVIDRRLRDHSDSLDIDTLGDLVRYLIGESSGVPST